MIVSLPKAISLIKSGHVVAMPTETVYGLAAEAFNANAVRKTFDVKERPADNPLIVHISSLNQLAFLATTIPDDFYTLAQAFWPGPLTFVLHKKNEVPDIVTGGLETVAVRMPDHPIPLALIKATGPLTAPSANKSGKPSPTKASHVEKDYNGEIPVLDGGASEIGLESTVLDLTVQPYTILRQGKISADELADVLPKHQISVRAETDQLKKSPGTKYTHYKPDAKVHWLNPEDSHTDTNGYYILHSDRNCSFKKIFQYSGDFHALASDLYDHFRTADYLNTQNIYIESLPSDEIHRMIAPLRDRINRALGS